MKKIFIIFLLLNLLFFTNHTFSKSISESQTFLFRPDTELAFLSIEKNNKRNPLSTTIFQKETNLCSLINMSVYKDFLTKKTFIVTFSTIIDTEKLVMGYPKISMQGHVRVGNDYENAKNNKRIFGIPYLGQTTKDRSFLFAPFWRFESSENRQLETLVQYIDTNGDIAEYINSMRELIGFTIENSILKPSYTRPKNNKKSLEYPYLLIIDTKKMSYVGNLYLRPNEVVKFAECAEPILKATFKLPLVKNYARPTYLFCTGRDPMLDIKLPDLNFKLDFQNGISKVVQGKEFSIYSLSHLDQVKINMQYGLMNKRKPHQFFSYRFNNAPPSLLNAQDKMFGGYDVWSRFVSSNFYKNTNGTWVHNQIIRDLNYKPEILKRNCVKKNKKWWKNVTHDVKGLKD